MKLVDFNQEQTLITPPKMIIIYELAFKFVKNEGFRKFMEDVQPKFIITRYCMHVFNDENEKLMHVLFANKQMFSLTMDNWTSIAAVSIKYQTPCWSTLTHHIFLSLFNLLCYTFEVV